MVFVHPNLRAFLSASASQPGLADTSAEVARAANEARARSGPPGPQLDIVEDYLVDIGSATVPIRVYRPKDPLGVTVAFHGGAWTIGSIETFDRTSRYLARDSQTVVVNVGYRLAPEHPFPAALTDGLGVMKWLMREGQGLWIPTSKMMLFGESAGGNLAAVLALMARDEGWTNVRLQVLVYPPLDPAMQSHSSQELSEGFFLSKADLAYMYKNYGVGGEVQSTDWQIKPLNAPTFRDLCPALIISAAADPLVDDAKEYAERLMEAGVETTHVIYSGMSHLFFGMRDTVKTAAMAQNQAAAALKSAATE